jgi:hypothetical protein
MWTFIIILGVALLGKFIYDSTNLKEEAKGKGLIKNRYSYLVENLVEALTEGLLDNDETRYHVKQNDSMDLILEQHQFPDGLGSADMKTRLTFSQHFGNQLNVEIRLELTDRHNGRLFQASGKEHVVRKKNWKFPEEASQERMLETMTSGFEQFSMAVVGELFG